MLKEASDAAMSTILLRKDFPPALVEKFRYCDTDDILTPPDYLVCVRKSFGQLCSHYGFSVHLNPSGVFLFPEEAFYLYSKEKICLSNPFLLPQVPFHALNLGL